MTCAQSGFLSLILLLVLLLGYRRVIVKTEKAKAMEAVNKYIIS
jgi:hypothetical protein